MAERVTLKSGDYVATAGMDEATYHAVARAFIEAGANEGEYPFDDHEIWRFVGWNPRRGRFEHWDTGDSFGGCQISLDYFATDSTATTDLVAAVRTAKHALDDAREEYRKALDALREELGEGFVIAEAGETPEPDEPDMTDPANWRAGDVVECVRPEHSWWTHGKRYSIKSFDADGWPKCTDDHGDTTCINPRHLRFHHRPNT